MLKEVKYSGDTFFVKNIKIKSLRYEEVCDGYKKRIFERQKGLPGYTFTFQKKFVKTSKRFVFLEILITGILISISFHNKNSDGSSSIELVLETGKEYQFRYLCDGQTWLNEPEADKQNITHYGDSKNSVIIV